MASEALEAESSLLVARCRASRSSSRRCDSASASPAFPPSPVSLRVSSLMVSGLLGAGSLGVGAAGLGGAFCSGTVWCSPDFLEVEAGRADTGVCAAVAGEGCTSFLLTAATCSHLQVKIKITNYLSDEDTGIEGRR